MGTVETYPSDREAAVRLVLAAFDALTEASKQPPAVTGAAGWLALRVLGVAPTEMSAARDAMEEGR